MIRAEFAARLKNACAAVTAAEAELTEWEKSSGIFNTDETEEELYELAK